MSLNKLNRKKQNGSRKLFMDNHNLRLFNSEAIDEYHREKQQKEFEEDLKRRELNEPDISICMILSRGTFINWAIHQINKQTKYLRAKGIACEIIVISPNELEIHDKYYKVKNLKSDENNIGYMRNKLCSHARGKYIGFMDDDDWYPEYKLHIQFVTLEYYHKDINIATVDQFLCYDLENTYSINVASESCLFFRTSYFKNSAFGFNTKALGEGLTFVSGQKVYIEKEIDLIVAIRHGSNVSEHVNKEVICSGLHPMLPFDNYEKNFLSLLKDFVV